MFILIFVHPRSRISDPGSKNATKERGAKKISCPTFFRSGEEKNLATLKKIIELFTQKIVITLSKYRFDIRDPGSKRHRIAAATILIYNKKPDLIKEELGGKVVLLGERGDGEGAALL